MIKFTKERVLLLYQMIVKSTGGIFGIRDENMLESAIETPYQTFDGVELYSSKIEKAARLCYGLVANHPFVDGNKRIGVYIMLSFLEVNGVYLLFSDKEIEELAINIANGSIKYDDILQILKSKM